MRSNLVKTGVLAALLALGIAAQAAPAATAATKRAVDLPPSADLAYDLAAEHRGFGLKGEALIAWRAAEDSYDVTVEARVPLQLAAIARADPSQLAGDIDIQVGEERDATVYRFVVVGKEEIDTKRGKLQVVHLSRPPKEGSYRTRLDIWLAPARGWYPVQIRSTEASGAVTTQTVNNIAVTDTGK